MANEFRTGLPTDKERRAAGRTLREKLKRGEMGHWRPKSQRADPVDLIEEAHAGRLERLIPVRVGRMVVSPVRLPARGGLPDGGGLRWYASHGNRTGHLRRRAPWKFRVLRFSGARPRLRPQRFRRSAPRTVGVGPLEIDDEHLGRRSPERPRRRHV